MMTALNGRSLAPRPCCLSVHIVVDQASGTTSMLPERTNRWLVDQASGTMTMLPEHTQT